MYNVQTSNMVCLHYFKYFFSKVPDYLPKRDYIKIDKVFEICTRNISFTISYGMIEILFIYEYYSFKKEGIAGE